MIKTSIPASMALAFVLAGPAASATIGVLESTQSNAFQNIIADAVRSSAEGHTLEARVAEKDPDVQIAQLKELVGLGVDAVIAIPATADLYATMSQIAGDAGVPLVLVNQGPRDASVLLDGQTYVGSDENNSGTFQTEEICNMLTDAGKTDGARVAVLRGDPNHFASGMRTEDIYRVVERPECSFMSIVAEDTANWSRDTAQEIVAGWLEAGEQFDAIIANNDEMALGAIAAYKATGASLDDVVIGGVDATMDALQAMAAGELDVTVFQNGKGQGEGAVDAALKLASGGDMPKFVNILFEPVTIDTMGMYFGSN